MNGVDIIIVIILAIGLLSGLARGFVRTLFGLAGIALGLVAAARLFDTVGSSFLAFIANDRVAAALAFLLVFVVVFLLVALLGRLVARALELASLGWADRLAGGLAGVVMACLAAGALLWVVFAMGWHENRALQCSRLAPSVLSVTDGIVALIPEGAWEALDKEYESLRGDWQDARRREGTTLL